MKYIVLFILICFGIFTFSKLFASQTKESSSTDLTSTKDIVHFHDLSYTTILGEEIPFSSYKDKVVLIVNTASKCGFTYQYKHLQELYLDYHDKPLEIIGFPCNQFGSQEPGSNKDIQNFCEIRYKTTFPMSEKVDVSGENQSSIYSYLTSPKTNPDFSGPVSWNFNKFLINHKGYVIARFSSMEKPSSRKVRKIIDKAIAEIPTTKKQKSNSATN